MPNLLLRSILFFVVCGVSASSSALADFPDLLQPGPAAGEVGAVEEDATGAIVTTVSALVIVLAVFGALVWVARRYGGIHSPSGTLPEDVFRLLGTSTLDGRTRISYLRVGLRIVVIGQTPNGEPTPITEVTDPEEVERITGRCMGRPEIVGRRDSYSYRDSVSDATKRADLAAG